MKTPLTALAAANVVRVWTRIYTRGLPAPVRAARRLEIDTDLWESLCEAGRRREAGMVTALRILGRLGPGVIDDLGWRFEHVSLRHVTHVVEMTVVALVIVTLGVAALLEPVIRADRLPVPPALPPVVMEVPPPPLPAPAPPPPNGRW